MLISLRVSKSQPHGKCLQVKIKTLTSSETFMELFDYIDLSAC